MATKKYFCENDEYSQHGFGEIQKAWKEKKSSSLSHFESDFYLLKEIQEPLDAHQCFLNL